MKQTEFMRLIRTLDERMYDRILDDYVENGTTYTREEMKEIYNKVIAKKKAVKT